MSFLISSSWVLNEAQSLGVKASDTEVHKKFEALKSQEFAKPAEFQKFLASSGQSVSDLLLRVKLNLLSQKIQQKIVKDKGTLGNAQLEKYYKEHLSQFGTPEKRNVNVILTKTEAQAKQGQKGTGIGQELCDARQDRFDRPDQQVQRRSARRA